MVNLSKLRETKWKNQETLVRLGEEAEVLLDSEAFSSTMNQLVDTSFQNFTNTAPNESEKRETAYHIIGHLWTSSRRYASASL